MLYVCTLRIHLDILKDTTAERDRNAKFGRRAKTEGIDLDRSKGKEKFKELLKRAANQ